MLVAPCRKNWRSSKVVGFGWRWGGHSSVVLCALHSAEPQLPSRRAQNLLDISTEAKIIPAEADPGSQLPSGLE